MLTFILSPVPTQYRQEIDVNSLENVNLYFIYGANPASRIKMVATDNCGNPDLVSQQRLMHSTCLPHIIFEIGGCLLSMSADMQK